MAKDFLRMGRKAQVTIFVIVALVIVAGIVIYFAVRDGLDTGDDIPEEFVPIYATYLGCIEEATREGIDILGTQGGRIDIGDYVPGSAYSPFSTHLEFLGNPIPYWYYITQNNFVVENIPTNREMEGELEDYIELGIANCNLDNYYLQGFFVDLDNAPSAEVDISQNSVNVILSSSVTVSRDGKSARKIEHNVQVSSRIGELYEMAIQIYEKQSQDAFLEGYAVDVLRNYVPVDGVEIQCSPEIWKAREVVDELHNALSANLGSIKIKGSSYILDEDSDEYFVVDAGNNIDANVQVLYSPNWPSITEVSPGDDEILIAEPVGTQGGLGVMGFCYVPYHFVWDVKFPALIQLSSGEEIFEFPVAVVIDNNVARESVLMSIAEEPEVDACEYYSGDVEIRTYDSDLNPIDGVDLTYKCFSSECRLGTSEFIGQDAKYEGGIPQCVNGEIIANAEGYAQKRVVFSSNDEFYADIILDREYETLVEVLVDGQTSSGTAIVNFDDGERGVVAALPENDNVILHEGEYDISVFVYGDSSVVIPSTTRRQCNDVPQGGLAGIFGQTEEECVDIQIPETRVEHALLGGGKTKTYITREDLSAGRVRLDVEGLQRPTTLQQLQENYASFETGGIDLRFT